LRLLVDLISVWCPRAAAAMMVPRSAFTEGLGVGIAIGEGAVDRGLEVDEVEEGTSSKAPTRLSSEAAEVLVS
jgi:hypothetical protein